MLIWASETAPGRGGDVDSLSAFPGGDGRALWLYLTLFFHNLVQFTFLFGKAHLARERRDLAGLSSIPNGFGSELFSGKLGSQWVWVSASSPDFAKWPFNILTVKAGRSHTDGCLDPWVSWLDLWDR